MSLHHDHEETTRRSGAANRRRLLWVLVLAAVYMVAELVGGLLTNSLALLADAGHMLSDVAGLALSWFAVWIADRPPTAQRTYGYYRAEILAALANGATLIAVSIFIFVEAYKRIWEPPAVEGGWMMVIASGGLLVNFMGLWILHGGRDENLNVRGAWLHVASDALGSVGAITAGGLIWAFAWYWADPLISVVIGVLIIISSLRLLAEAVSVLMESTPRGIDVDQVRSAIMEVAGVLAVHDLHVWTITSGLDALSAHVVVPKGRAHAPVLRAVRQTLHERFGIDHLTIQIEPEGFAEVETSF